MNGLQPISASHLALMQLEEMHLDLSFAGRRTLRGLTIDTKTLSMSRRINVLLLLSR